MQRYQFLRQLLSGGATALIAVSCVLAPGAVAGEPKIPESIRAGLSESCYDCHAGPHAEAGLDLSSLSFDLTQSEIAERWVQVHDRIQAGEMPPPDDGRPRPVAAVGWSIRELADQDLAALDGPRQLLRALAVELVRADQQRIAETGRSQVRRLNRYEYENTLRQLLAAPWLLIADRLPEDGVEHLFPKSGRRLDVSHVQLTTYFKVAEEAIRAAVTAAAHPPQTVKLYAREEATLARYLHYRVGQTAATRAIVPLDGIVPEVDVLRKLKPVSVGASDPQKREREAMGVFSGTYSATTKYDFISAPAACDGQYRLRFKTYTFMAGPWGGSGGDDEGLSGGNRAWWRPDRSVTFAGRRSEPVTLYALNPSGENRWLTSFDSHPEPSVFECLVVLRQGEGIRPDATRLIRTRPGWSGNPHATAEGVPGFAMNWLEIEGPLQPQWPPASYQAIFGDLPFEVTASGAVRVTPVAPRAAAHELLKNFLRRALAADPPQAADAVAPYLQIYDKATQLGYDFTDALITSCAAIVCSPEFLYLHEQPGPLPAAHVQRRLAYFLWNSPPDDLSSHLTSPPAVSSLHGSSASAESPSGEAPSGDSPRGEATSGEATSGEAQSSPAPQLLTAQVDRMLADPRSQRFVNHFLDYWLNLRDLFSNSPDATLYPDYYLDDWLVESSLRETRLFFSELIAHDLPARQLIDSDFTYVNERLAELYDLPHREGADLWRVTLPDDSPRGGLLTQASILRVTANGTTTSPVVRGAWVMERLMGRDIPPPPSGVSAIEPDIRGATTILEQLTKHRQIETCNACHAHFDPAGIGLESFDVCGGWRQRYRATGTGADIIGIGKNGHAFTFKLALPVESAGQLLDGRQFDDIRQMKQHLASDERQLARNLLHQLIVYATGTAVSFADRAEVEDMLDRASEKQYGVRTLIHEVVNSEIFRSK